MVHTYSYSVLIATPSARRGERVNLGIIVFKGDDIDIRLMHASYKLKFLTRQDWEDRIEFLKESILSTPSGERDPQSVLARISMYEPSIAPSDLGMINVTNDSDYESQVNYVLSALVGLPRREQVSGRTTRINTEIAADFRKSNILAKGEETIEQKKVVRDFELDGSEGLRADFALRNGVIHVVSTIDLRPKTVDLGTAALKSMVLIKALKKFGTGNVKCFGAYAVDPDMRDSFSQHLTMVGEHAIDGFWDWTSLPEKNKLRRSVFDALEHDAPLI